MVLEHIKTLWIGNELSLFEQLSLRSFVATGHDVDLFTYGKVKNIPDGVRVRDANSILDESFIFTHKKGGGVSGFANWFRYEMLLREGGIWVDTDIICLKPFKFEQRLVFGKEEYGMYNNAVLGGHQGEDLFRHMATQAKDPHSVLPYDLPKIRAKKWVRKYLQGNQRNNIKRGEVGPRGISKAIHHFKLEQYGLPYTAFYPIHSKCWDAIFDNTYPDIEKYFPDSYAIHLWNEMIRKRSSLNKNSSYPTDSLIEALKERYL